jgi:alpha/beta superfamily hydrolase
MRNAVILLLSAFLILAGGSGWLALFPNVPADLGGVESLDSQARHVKIPVGDDHIDGWYLAGEKPVTVVLLAGYARDHRRMWRYAHFLHAQGLGVLNVDFRSVRRTARKPTTLGYWEMQDAAAAVDWLRANPASAEHEVVLFGESLGAATAITLAAGRPDIAAVVADCPFATADAAIADGFELVLRIPSAPSAPLTAIARLFGRWTTGYDPGTLDVTRSLKALSGRPVLVIQTARGDRFAARQVEQIKSALGLSGETWDVDDVKHNQAWMHHREKYEERVSTFLRSRLALEGAPVLAAKATPVLAAKATRAAASVVTAPEAELEPAMVAVGGSSDKTLRQREP